MTKLKTKNSKVLVAIPAYNCEKQIARTLKGFNTHLLSLLSEIIVIDNRSTDNTAKKAIQTIKTYKLKKCSVLKNYANYGLGGSHKVAFNYALKYGFTHVVILHGDNQAITQEIALLLDKLQENPTLDAVLGARFLPQSTLKGYSKTRILGNKGLNLIFTILTQRPTHDLGSGINLFASKFLKSQEYLGFENGLTFNIDLLLSLFSKKAAYIYVPITWVEEDQVSNAKAAQVGLKALELLLNWRFNFTRQTTKKGYGYELVYKP